MRVHCHVCDLSNFMSLFMEKCSLLAAWEIDDPNKKFADWRHVSHSALQSQSVLLQDRMTVRTALTWASSLTNLEAG